MLPLLDDHCAIEDLKAIETKYNKECEANCISNETEFEYASVLIRSRYPADIEKGVVLLEKLYNSKTAKGKRDYVYFLAIGNARLKKYNTALLYLEEGILKVEPHNQQGLSLQVELKSRLRKEEIHAGLKIGGGVLVGGLLALGALALAKK